MVVRNGGCSCFQIRFGFFRLCSTLDRSQSLFYFVPHNSHNSHNSHSHAGFRLCLTILTVYIAVCLELGKTHLIWFCSIWRACNDWHDLLLFFKWFASVDQLIFYCQRRNFTGDGCAHWWWSGRLLRVCFRVSVRLHTSNESYHTKWRNHRFKMPNWLTGALGWDGIGWPLMAYAAACGPYRAIAPWVHPSPPSLPHHPVCTQLHPASDWQVLTQPIGPIGITSISCQHRPPPSSKPTTLGHLIYWKGNFTRSRAMDRFDKWWTS